MLTLHLTVGLQPISFSTMCTWKRSKCLIPPFGQWPCLWMVRLQTCAPNHLKHPSNDRYIQGKYVCAIDNWWKNILPSSISINQTSLPMGSPFGRGNLFHTEEANHFFLCTIEWTPQPDGTYCRSLRPYLPNSLLLSRTQARICVTQLYQRDPAIWRPPGVYFSPPVFAWKKNNGMPIWIVSLDPSQTVKLYIGYHCRCCSSSCFGTFPVNHAASF